MANNQRPFNLIRYFTSSLIMIIRKKACFTLLNYCGIVPKLPIGKFTWQYQSFPILYLLSYKNVQVQVLP